MTQDALPQPGSNPSARPVPSLSWLLNSTANLGTRRVPPPLSPTPAAGQREFVARHGIGLLLEWWPRDDGLSVVLQVLQFSGTGYGGGRCWTLGMLSGLRRRALWNFGRGERTIDFHIWLADERPTRGAHQANVSLHVDVPLPDRGTFRGEVAQWPYRVDNSPAINPWIEPLKPWERRVD